MVDEIDLTLFFRRARIEDLKFIIELLIDDELGKSRESLFKKDFENYETAFNKINDDKNHFLMVGILDKKIISTCHLTILPTLNFQGSNRLQIESVRVSKNLRGQKIGEKMIAEALNYAEINNCKIVQLTTNKERPRAQNFYKKLGFKASHEGMKLEMGSGLFHQP